MHSLPLCGFGPDFAQQTPIDPDLLELLEGDHQTGTLRYRDPRTGQTWTVPNVPGNQQVHLRLGATKLHLGLAKLRLRALADRSHPFLEWAVNDCHERIRALRSIRRTLQAKARRLARRVAPPMHSLQGPYRA